MRMCCGLACSNSSRASLPASRPPSESGNSVATPRRTDARWSRRSSSFELIDLLDGGLLDELPALLLRKLRHQIGQAQRASVAIFAPLVVVEPFDQLALMRALRISQQIAVAREGRRPLEIGKAGERGDQRADRRQHDRDRDRRCIDQIGERRGQVRIARPIDPLARQAIGERVSPSDAAQPPEGVVRVLPFVLEQLPRVPRHRIRRSALRRRAARGCAARAPRSPLRAAPARARIRSARRPSRPAALP